MSSRRRLPHTASSTRGSPATSLDNAGADPREHKGTPVPVISLGVKINLIKNVICPSAARVQCQRGRLAQTRSGPVPPKVGSAKPRRVAGDREGDAGAGRLERSPGVALRGFLWCFRAAPAVPSLVGAWATRGATRARAERRSVVTICWAGLVSPDVVSDEVTFLSEKRSKQDGGFWSCHKARWVAWLLSTAQ